MPRLRRSDKRKHEVTLELRCVLANAAACGDPGLWVKYWGGPDEARVAFEALRHTLNVKDGDDYEAWLRHFAAEAKRRGWLDADDEPDPDEDAVPWGR
ncbi:MAG: hypothetical protein DMD33_18585 [Gemmatimonadetes bacterium]|nr:MAG: hypothetical protein DMD33_18585 [Gemmatimonadota bacterium]